WLGLLLLFIRAEDGIRVLIVTGVQTCALPIFERVGLAADPLDFSGFDGVFHLAGQPGVRSFGDVFPLYLRRNVLATQRVFEAARSEERRVGKERSFE